MACGQENSQRGLRILKPTALGLVQSLPKGHPDKRQRFLFRRRQRTGHKASGQEEIEHLRRVPGGRVGGRQRRQLTRGKTRLLAHLPGGTGLWCLTLLEGSRRQLQEIPHGVAPLPDEEEFPVQNRDQNDRSRVLDDVMVVDFLTGSHLAPGKGDHPAFMKDRAGNLNGLFQMWPPTFP